MREGPLPVTGMHQYYNNGSRNGHPDYGDSRSPTDTHTTTSYLTPNAAGVAGAGADGAGLAYAPSSTSISPPRSAKEREAFARYNTTASSGNGSAQPGGSGGAGSGLHVVNPQDDVVVHQDGGRVRIPPDDEQPVEREIPPTYDSIPADDSRR